ncbi:MAG: CaiB/BaiF CoA-transferase family protein [Mycobacterium sp.]
MKNVLDGIRVVEIAALGPAPFAAMMLADAGADVVRITRPDDPGHSGGILERGRPTFQIDLKDAESRCEVAALIKTADVLIEGFRPGVMERLGLGPDICLAENPRLVYARMTGWGQNGSLAKRPGHDINYLAHIGALHCLARRDEPPMPPLNLVADFGGGGMLLAYGVLAALIGRGTTGRGCVVDAAMADGSNLLMVGVWSRLARGSWSNTPGTNDIDTGAPYYNVYETSDGRYLAFGAVEPAFYRQALTVLKLSPDDFVASQHDRADWPRAREAIANAVRTRDFAHWQSAFDNVDACVTPVLTLEEALQTPFARERGLFTDVDGAAHPSPAPRFGYATPSREVPDGDSLHDISERWGRQDIPK